MSEKLIKCVAVGDGFVGKTCLLMRLVKKEFDEHYAPTIFDNSSLTVSQEGDNYDLLFIDTAGQEEYSLLRQQAYEGADVFLVCFSVANMSSFVNVKEVWLPEIENSKNAAKILIGTKSDLRTDPETIDDKNMAGEFFVKKNVAENLAKGCKMQYLECSSKTMENLEEIIKTIIEISADHVQVESRPRCGCVNPALRLIHKVLCCRSNY